MNFTTDIVASETLTAPMTDFDRNYTILLQLAFGDALHDDVINGNQAVASAPNNNFQCNLFNNAMPADGKQLCPAAGVANGGLPIPVIYKTKTEIEETLFNSVIVGYVQLTATLTETTPTIINGIGITPVANISINTLTNNSAIKTVNNKTYKINYIEYAGTSTIDINNPNVCGETVMNNMGITPGSALLIDVDGGAFLRQLKKGPSSPSRLYYLMLPEYLSDSASKKKWQQNKTYSKTDGIKILFAGKLSSNYPIWDRNNRNSFFSNYLCAMNVLDWKLGLITQTWRQTPTSIPLYTTPNPNKDNNRESVVNYIVHMGNTDQKALAYQRKRSGDQLQALAIKRLTNNERFHISSDIGENALKTTTNPSSLQQLSISAGGASVPNLKRHAYLVTHDLTLCSYALFLGINVIYSRTEYGTKTKKIWAFRLLSDSSDNNN